MSDREPTSPNGSTEIAIPGLREGQEPTVLVDGVSKWFGDIVAVSNVTFGGPKKNRLFITATTSLYAITLNRRGVQWP